MRFLIIGVDGFTCSLLKVIESVITGSSKSPLMAYSNFSEIDFIGVFGDKSVNCDFVRFSPKPFSDLSFDGIDTVVLSSSIPERDILSFAYDALNNNCNIILLSNSLSGLDDLLIESEKRNLITAAGRPFSYLDGVVLGSLAKEYIELLGFKGLLDIVDFTPAFIYKKPISFKVSDYITYTAMPKESILGFSGESVFNFKLGDEHISLLFSSSSHLDLLGFKILDTIIAVWAFKKAGFVGFPGDLCRFFSLKCVLEKGHYIEALRNVFQTVKKVVFNER